MRTRQGYHREWFEATRKAIDAGKRVYIPVINIHHAERITNMFPDCVFEAHWDPTPQGLSSRGHMQMNEHVDFTPCIRLLIVTKP